MMKYKVGILTEARLQLRDIATYYKLKVGPESAKRITDRILDAIDKLSDFPKTGVTPPSELVAEAGYLMLVVDDYLCFYQTFNEIIYITHIVHGSTNYIKKLL